MGRKVKIFRFKGSSKCFSSLFLSSDFCLCHSEQVDLAIYKQVKILRNKRVIDVACGNHFTVIIAAEFQKKTPNLPLEEFKKINLNHFQNKTNLLKEMNEKRIGMTKSIESSSSPVNINQSMKNKASFNQKNEIRLNNPLGHKDNDEKNEKLLSNMSNLIKRTSSFGSMIQTEPSELSAERSKSQRN
jgi:uncharacterized protein (DUF4213/DUF364 family)